MKRIVFAAVLLVLFGAARAQKVYFIYIQSDSNTPFFVKMGDKVTSSTVSGYLILPKLVDSVYQLAVGKTGNAAGESRFAVTINKKDRGFLLKESDGKFSLFDLQSLALVQPLAAATTPGETIAKRTDPFTVLLSQAANDPSLLEVRTATAITAHTEKMNEPEPEPAIAVTTKAPEEEPALPTKTDTAAPTEIAATETTSASPVEENSITGETGTDTVQQAVNTETAETDTGASSDKVETSMDAAQQAANTASEPDQTTAEQEQTYKRSVVTRRSESSTSEGFGLTFLDEHEGSVDTIRIVIPNQNTVIWKAENEDEDSKKFLNISNTDSVKETSVAAANEKLRAAEKRKRAACQAAASERDFFRLRKNMAAEESDEAMISAAKKAFKKTCFSTGQVRNLSTLFLTAGSKYQFFDAAYGHVSDQEQYAVLQNELNDDYYVSRFKALIAKQ